MINFITGKVLFKKKNFIILERNGLGFKIFLSEKNLEKIQEGEDVKIFTYFSIRNEKPELYGVLSLEELELFEILEKVSGIGPKAALILSSLGSFKDFQKAIESGDYKFFEGIKGVGKKKIQKIILEIGGELKKLSQKPRQEDEEVIKALTSLGFSKSEAQEALLELPEDITDTETRIKKALQILAKR